MIRIQSLLFKLIFVWAAVTMVLGMKPPIRFPFGVNLVGDFKNFNGLSEMGRLIVQAIESNGIPYELVNWTPTGTVKTPSYQLKHPYLFNLFIISPELLNLYLQSIAGSENEVFGGHYNIGYWTWEAEHMPKSWIGHFVHFDEIWAETNFVQNALAVESPIPVVRLPNPVGFPTDNMTNMRKNLGIKPDEFVFLFMFDYYSFVERKNPDGVIKAFRQAFKTKVKGKTPKLIIKTQHADFVHAAPYHQQLKVLAEGLNVQFIDMTATQADTRNLIYSADAYISLHRGEGFGLTLAESMFLGKPTIATRYSGNLDFMNGNNSILVDHRDYHLANTWFIYTKGMYFVDPDVNDAAKGMRRLVEEPQFAEQIGRAGEYEIKTYFSPEACGARMLGRLRSVYHMHIDTPTPSLITKMRTAGYVFDDAYYRSHNPEQHMAMGPLADAYTHYRSHGVAAQHPHRFVYLPTHQLSVVDNEIRYFTGLGYRWNDTLYQQLNKLTLPNSQGLEHYRTNKPTSDLVPAWYYDRSPHFQSIGCFKDNEDRTVPNAHILAIKLETITLEECAGLARDHGFTGFAVEARSECRGVSDFTLAQALGPSSACKPCPSASENMHGCGGDWANNIYRLG